MAELTVFIIGLVSAIGAVIGSYLGYRQAKKADPTITYDYDAFITSMLRALPGIFVAAGVGIFANMDFTTMSIFGVALVLLNAFVSGTGSDVAIKRAWNSATVNPTTAPAVASAKVAVAKFKSRLMFLSFRN